MLSYEGHLGCPTSGAPGYLIQQKQFQFFEIKWALHYLSLNMGGGHVPLVVPLVLVHTLLSIAKSQGESPRNDNIPVLMLDITHNTI